MQKEGVGVKGSGVTQALRLGRAMWEMEVADARDRVLVVNRMITCSLLTLETHCGL